MTMRDGLYIDAFGDLWIIAADTAQLIRENGKWMTSGDMRYESASRVYHCKTNEPEFTSRAPHTRIEIK